MKKAYLQIITWKGSLLVWDAEHFYGTLRFGDKEVDVDYNMTKAEAARFNKADPTKLRKSKPGDHCSRFTDEDKLIKTAIKLFEEDNRGFDVLIKGDNCSCDPQEILVGPAAIKVKANRLNDLFDQEGGWDSRNKVRIENICEKWTLLVGPVWEK